MAPSSLKKMRRVQKRKEGNYASSKKASWDTSTNSDLELTLLSGSQISRKDKESCQYSRESSSKQLGSKHVEKWGQWASLETDTQAKYPTQTTTLLDKARTWSAAPISRSISPPFSPTTARMQRERLFLQGERLFLQDFNSKGVNGVLQHITKSTVVNPYDELNSSVSEAKTAKSYQRSDWSPCPVEKRLRCQLFNERQYLKVGMGKSQPWETQYGPFNRHGDQNLSEIEAVDSEKAKEAGATIRLPSSGSGGGIGPSEPVSHCQERGSPNVNPIHFHQCRTSSFRGSAFRDSDSTLLTSASRSPSKHPSSDLGKLTILDQSPNLLKVFTQNSAHSPVDIQTHVVKRSWTNFFPTKARPRRLRLPAPSSLAAPLTPNKKHEYRSISAPLRSTNLLSHARFWTTPPSPYVLRNNLDSAHAGKQRQSALRRSASMPNFRSKLATTSMDHFNNLRPSSLPTPPHERLSSPAYFLHPGSLTQYENGPLSQNFFSSSHNNVDRSFNADNSTPQNCQINSNFPLQYKIGLSDGQSSASKSNLHLHQVPTQPFFSHPVSKDEFDATAGSHFVHRRLAVKSNYSHEEVEHHMLSLVEQGQTLRAENASLRSVNIAMKKGVENKQQENAWKNQQIQRYKRTLAQKDRVIEAMQQEGDLLQRQYQQVWDEYHLLIAALRKENGTGNPRAIAHRILWNNTSSATGAASQGSPSNVYASPVHYANDTQPNPLRLKSKQASAGLQEPVQLVPGPIFPDGSMTDASGRSSSQQGFAAGSYSNADPRQMVPHSAHSETTTAKSSSSSLVQQGFAAIDCNSASSEHEQFARWVQSNQPPGVSVGNITGGEQNNNDPEVLKLTERVTVDLTDDSQPPSTSTLCDSSVPETCPSSVQGGNLPSSTVTSEHLPAQYPAGHYTSSQGPLGLSSQDQTSQFQLQPNQDSQLTKLGATQIQKKESTRMAERSFSWLQGENPFRKGTNFQQRCTLPSPQRISQSNAEEYVSTAGDVELGSIAPLPETAADQNTKKAQKERVILTAVARKERAKAYRKTAAEKKKREKEAGKQLLQDNKTFKNTLRAHNQDRRLIKGQRRRQQARNTLGEPEQREAEDTLGGRLFQKSTGYQQVVPHRSIEQASLDDGDSLFGDNEDNQMEVEESTASREADTAMHRDDDAAMEESVADYAAEVEAMFIAENDSGTRTDAEQSAAPGDENLAFAVQVVGDEDSHDFSCTSEESEEE